MRKLLLVIVPALGAGAAHAADTFYLGAGISRSQLSDITHNGVSISDIKGTSWKAFAGFRPISAFAVEADYLDLGGETSPISTGGSTHSDAKAFAGYAVGFLPIPVPYLDLFGKAGLSRWQVNGNTSGTGGSLFSFSNTGTEFAWGLGAQVHAANFGGRLEYENFNVPNTSGAHIVSLSVYLTL